MKRQMKLAVAAVLGVTALAATAAGNKADRPKPLDPVKSAK